MKACLLVRSEGPRIDSLSQLAEKPAVRPLLFANSILVSMLGRSTRPDWHRVWLMVERHGGLVPIEALYASSHLDAVARGSAVILSDRTSFRYVVGRTCARFPSSQFYIGKEPVNTLSFGLYANARLPHEFRRKMDQRLGWLRESGLLDLWTARMLPDWAACARRSELGPLGLHHVRAALLSSVLLVAAALLALAVELVLDSRSKRAARVQVPARTRGVP
ncbi:uncharacterized protein LOC8053438 [Ixodes scapularis]|uniref:uncharacterized protein LOC8053438 n=1 Tax=Ixodes scapularis TaxID=6945 RepID=UPI001C3900F2|nr:uncharacterized protein LOC8053438 [Ixodes scapularis]